MNIDKIIDEDLKKYNINNYTIKTSEMLENPENVDMQEYKEISKSVSDILEFMQYDSKILVRYLEITSEMASVHNKSRLMMIQSIAFNYFTAVGKENSKDDYNYKCMNELLTGNVLSQDEKDLIVGLFRRWRNNIKEGALRDEIESIILMDEIKNNS